MICVRSTLGCRWRRSRQRAAGQSGWMERSEQVAGSAARSSGMVRLPAACCLLPALALAIALALFVSPCCAEPPHLDGPRASRLRVVVRVMPLTRAVSARPLLVAAHDSRQTCPAQGIPRLCYSRVRTAHPISVPLTHEFDNGLPLSISRLPTEQVLHPLPPLPSW